MPAVDQLHWSADAFERLGQLREERDVLGWMIEEAVRECRGFAPKAGEDWAETVSGETRTNQRLRPFSWAEIGRQLGISRQTAWERFHE